MPLGGTMAKGPPASPEGLCTPLWREEGPAPLGLGLLHTSLRERNLSSFRRRRKPGRSIGPFPDFPRDAGRRTKVPGQLPTAIDPPAIRLAAKRLRRRRPLAPLRSAAKTSTRNAPAACRKPPTPRRPQALSPRPVPHRFAWHYHEPSTGRAPPDYCKNVPSIPQHLVGAALCGRPLPRPPRGPRLSCAKGERAERCRGQRQRGERVAAVKIL